MGDGGATGATIRAALKAVRRHPLRIVVTLSVGPPDTIAEVGREVVCLAQPYDIQAIGKGA